MIAYRRPVRFEDVDSARIVFFGRYVSYAHEAMEHFLAGARGGYAGLVMERNVGFPAVRVELSYHAPLRYGEVLDIEVRTVRLGRRSAVLGYRFVRIGDGQLVAEMTHTVVVSDLVVIASRDMPDDVRAVLGAHLEPGPAEAPPSELEPSKLAELLRGQTQRYTLDRLFKFLYALGQDVEIVVRPAAK